MSKNYPAFYTSKRDEHIKSRYNGSIKAKRCSNMLPCQQNCPRHAPGCHKTCSQWKEFQHQQDLQRQQKKAYLKYYNELCAVRTRQLSILSPVWW